MNTFFTNKSVIIHSFLKKFLHVFFLILFEIFKFKYFFFLLLCKMFGVTENVIRIYFIKNITNSIYELQVLLIDCSTCEIHYKT